MTSAPHRHHPAAGPSRLHPPALPGEGADPAGWAGSGVAPPTPLGAGGAAFSHTGRHCLGCRAGLGGQACMGAPHHRRVKFFIAPPPLGPTGPGSGGGVCGSQPSLCLGVAQLSVCGAPTKCQVLLASPTGAEGLQRGRRASRRVPHTDDDGAPPSPQGRAVTRGRVRPRGGRVAPGTPPRSPAPGVPGLSGELEREQAGGPAFKSQVGRTSGLADLGL